MFSQKQSNSNTFGNDLLKAIAVCEERIRVSTINKQKYEEVKKSKESSEQLVKHVTLTANHMNLIYKNTKNFLEDKKKSSKQVLEDSIRAISNIVKDADMSTCVIEHKDNKTIVRNKAGHSINKREGGGARCVMGLIMKYACIKASPNKIQLMLLDEALAALSTDSSVNAKDLISSLSKDMCIIGIEQRDTIYSELASIKFKAQKSGLYSTITKEVITYVENSETS